MAATLWQAKESFVWREPTSSRGRFANRLRGYARASPKLFMVIDLRQCAGYGLGGLFAAPHLNGHVSDMPLPGAL